MDRKRCRNSKVLSQVYFDIIRILSSISLLALTIPPAHLNCPDKLMQNVWSSIKPNKCRLFRLWLNVHTILYLLIHYIVPHYILSSALILLVIWKLLILRARLVNTGFMLYMENFNIYAHQSGTFY